VSEDIPIRRRRYNPLLLPYNRYIIISLFYSAFSDMHSVWDHASPSSFRRMHALVAWLGGMWEVIGVATSFYRVEGVSPSEDAHVVVVSPLRAPDGDE
jgi:hypothetical protein